MDFHADASDATLETSRSRRDRAPTSPSVLVVEDDDGTRRRIASLLQGRGYNVTEALDGLAALHKLAAGGFDAIVLDLALPHVDGWQFRATQLSRPELACIPTVIVTIQTLRAPARYTLRSEHVVYKPFEDADLLAAVQQVCPIPNVEQADGTPETNGLLWSRRGEVACATHAPDVTSPRWRQEKWTEVPPDAGNGRIVYCCQHCTSDGRRIHHRKQS